MTADQKQDGKLELCSVSLFLGRLSSGSSREDLVVF